MIGESLGSQYRSKADEIWEATKDHYGKFGDYIYECDVTFFLPVFLGKVLLDLFQVPH